MTKSFLSEKEDIAIRKAVLNEDLVNGLKKVMFSFVHTGGALEEGQPAGDPSGNFALNKAFLAIQQDPHITNEMLGENLRADAQALRQMELAFKLLDNYKPREEPKKPEANQAR